MITISRLELEAIKFACRNHALARYGDKPYDVHPETVVNILIEFGCDTEVTRIGAWLHDIIEATDLSYNDIKKLFGAEVAEIVYLCTDLKGRNRDARKAEPLYLELRENLDATKVKVADRIANARESIENGHSMGEKYKKEYEKFRGYLYFVGHIDKMWDELDKLMSFNKN